jgi:hypothetical protein
VGRSDFDNQLAKLKSDLDETVTLLREDGERHWLSSAERCQRKVDEHEAAAYDHILSAYGGVGSFNDLLILAWNGHLVETDREKAVNDRLALLRTAMWTSATALRREIR